MAESEESKPAKALRSVGGAGFEDGRKTEDNQKATETEPPGGSKTEKPTPSEKPRHERPLRENPYFVGSIFLVLGLVLGFLPGHIASEHRSLQLGQVASSSGYDVFASGFRCGAVNPKDFKNALDAAPPNSEECVVDVRLVNRTNNAGVPAPSVSLKAGKQTFAADTYDFGTFTTLYPGEAQTQRQVFLLPTGLVPSSIKINPNPDSLELLSFLDGWLRASPTITYRVS